MSIRDGLRYRGMSTAIGAVAVLALAGGGSVVGVALASQQHAPQPAPRAAGTLGPATTTGAKKPPPAAPRAPVDVGPTLARSTPVSIDIPAIGVRSRLFTVGLNASGTIQVPPLNDSPRTNEAAWYKYSPTPGQLGPSIIEGHIDSAAQGASVFFRLGSLVPGNTVDVTLADGAVGVFTVTGVREYRKANFPTGVVYGNTNFAALRLLTCGGAFDDTTHHYLSNTVVFASLTSEHAAA